MQSPSQKLFSPTKFHRRECMTKQPGPIHAANTKSRFARRSSHSSTGGRPKSDYHPQSTTRTREKGTQQLQSLGRSPSITPSLQTLTFPTMANYTPGSAAQRLEDLQRQLDSLGLVAPPHIYAG